MLEGRLNVGSHRDVRRRVGQRGGAKMTEGDGLFVPGPMNVRIDAW